MIEIKKLYKEYTYDNKKVFALNNINLKIDVQGAVIIGSSGSGKSTLLRMMNRLEIPSKGDIFFHNNNLKDIDIKTIRTKIGIVFQQFNLFENFTIIENLTFSQRCDKTIDQKTIHNRAINLLEKFLLIDNMYKYPDQLSGGEQQRVAICRTLMNQPNIILFDEPTSALDVEKITNLVEIIKDISNYVIPIIVTHDIHFAKKLAQRIIFLNNGNIICDQLADDFFSNPNSDKAKIFLENTLY